jgi:hypothetical protein
MIGANWYGMASDRRPCGTMQLVSGDWGKVGASTRELKCVITLGSMGDRVLPARL